MPEPQFTAYRNDGLHLRLRRGTFGPNTAQERSIGLVKSLGQALRESEARLNRAPQFGKVVSWEGDAATGELLWSDHTYWLFGEEPGRVKTL